MLAKQLWGLSERQNSLVYKVLKAKYFRRGDILEAGIGYKPSYLWRSLMVAKELVLEGVSWRIGNGKKVSIM